MNAGVIEGLVGAHTNMRIADVPFQVYHGEEQKAKHSILKQIGENVVQAGNFAAMERAGEYMTKFTERANKYSDIAEEQLQKEMEENRKNEEAQREEILKKQKEENQQFYKTIREKQTEKAKFSSGSSLDFRMRNGKSAKASDKTSAIKKIEPTETKAYGSYGQAVTAVPKKPVFATTI